jgi:hypothetical protein
MLYLPSAYHAKCCWGLGTSFATCHAGMSNEVRSGSQVPVKEASSSILAASALAGYIGNGQLANTAPVRLKLLFQNRTSIAV